MVVGANLGRKGLRVAKSYTKGYSSTQRKVRDATSNDPAPPTSKDLHEIAEMSYDQMDFIEIMEVLDKRLNDRGKNWRHVYKTLTVLEYLLLHGAENVFKYCQDNLYEIKTLREFQYVDDNGVDRGIDVRQLARDITNLVLDPSSLHTRRRRHTMSYGEYPSGRPDPLPGDPSESDRQPGQRRGTIPSSSRAHTQRDDNEDDDLRRALAESKRLADEKSKIITSEDRDVQRAIELSKLDEEQRRKAVAAANNYGLFADAPSQPKNDVLIDLSGIQIPAAPLQVQYTVQPQPTTFAPQYTQIQPQFTSFQPQYTFGSSYQQQLYMDAAQTEYLRQQAEWTAAQQQSLAAQALQEDIIRQQMLQYQPTQKPIAPQPTGYGSNNPFAPGGPDTPRSVDDNNIPSPISSPASSRTSTRASSRATNADERHPQLAGLFTGGHVREDGVDTFGNMGLLRFGPTPAGRITTQKTGSSNPFARPQSSLAGF